MSAISSTVWNDIIGHFRVNHPQLVRGWFNELRPIDIQGGVVCVRTQNGAQARYLDQHCRFAFIEAAQAATGRLVSVAFEADGESENSNGKLVAGLWAGQDDLVLDPDYTFDNFVTGPGNRLAHAAAVAVSEDPGRAYNPLFVYGPVGLGKTHLLQAICHTICDRGGHTRCCYISCETFINHFIEAVECGGLHQFRHRYRHVDVLMIDDVQFLAERERSQEEFFHTFNRLYQSHRQIILSADCSPGEIPSLEERLVSRFNSGLVAVIGRPCFETRMAIVRKKAKLRCIEVPEEVVHLIAARIDTNIRDLEGALIKIDALSQADDRKLTLDLAREALGIEPQRTINISTILEVVAERFKTKVADLQSKRRAKTVTYPRHVSMYLARQLTSQSLEEIGGYFGGRDHSTVLHASRTIERLAKQKPEVRELLEQLTQDVRNAAG